MIAIALAAQILSAAPVPVCPDTDAGRAALAGWRAARAAAPAGGSRESLAAALAPLEALERLPARLDVLYAMAAIRAAMAAAQDERPEMGVFLDHARALALRAAEGPSCPLPFDLLEGELWMEVDVYERACEAYRRALPRLSGTTLETVRTIVAGPRCRQP